MEMEKMQLIFKFETIKKAINFVFFWFSTTWIFYSSFFSIVISTRSTILVEKCLRKTQVFSVYRKIQDFEFLVYQ